jgi:hypothetical protein
MTALLVGWRGKICEKARKPRLAIRSFFFRRRLQRHAKSACTHTRQHLSLSFPDASRRRSTAGMASTHPLSTTFPFETRPKGPAFSLGRRRRHDGSHCRALARAVLGECQHHRHAQLHEGLLHPLRVADGEHGGREKKPVREQPGRGKPRRTHTQAPQFFLQTPNHHQLRPTFFIVAPPPLRALFLPAPARLTSLKFGYFL